MVLKKNKIINSIWFIIVFMIFLNFISRSLALFFGVGSLTYTKSYLIIAATCGFLILAFNLFNKKNYNFYLYSAAILVFLMCFSVVVQVFFMRDAVGYEGDSAHSYLLVVFLYNILWFLIGYGIQAKIDLRFNTSLAISTLLFFLFFVFFISNGSFVLNYSYFTENLRSVGAGGYANHLILGSDFYIVLIALYSLCDRFKYFVVFLSLFLLFSLGGRANLFIYIVSIVVFELMKGYDVKRIFILIIVGAGALLALQLSGLLNTEGAARMTFEGGLAQDGSFIARVKLLVVGLSLLPSQILVGNVSGYVEVFKSTGAYIHNLFSIWQFYGLPTLFIIGLIFKVNYKRIKLLARNSGNPIVIFGSLIFISAAAGILTSKSVNYSILWLALGFVSGSNQFDRKNYKVI